MEKEKSIELKNICKSFNIGFKKNNGALGQLVSFVSGRETRKELEVLNNISFAAYPGQVIGLIGKNGSGKSTLLRVIAGIYQADSGQIKTQGRVDYLSGLSNGLSQKLTMEENIYLMGSLMGLGQNDIKQKFDDIVEFSGLKDFLYTKVYQFSSGMVTRLAFSVTIHCLNYSKPDILLLDEVYGSGGDIDFEEKAIEKMKEFIKGGSTVILASHNLEIIKNYCDAVLILHNGKIFKNGKPSDVIDEYARMV
mgnify:CR=1 FL=1